MIDLHIHTQKSDGNCSVKELLQISHDQLFLLVRSN